MKKILPLMLLLLPELVQGKMLSQTKILANYLINKGNKSHYVLNSMSYPNFFSPSVKEGEFNSNLGNNTYSYPEFVDLSGNGKPDEKDLFLILFSRNGKTIRIYDEGLNGPDKIYFGKDINPKERKDLEYEFMKKENYERLLDNILQKNSNIL